MLSDHSGEKTERLSINSSGVDGSEILISTFNSVSVSRRHRLSEQAKIPESKTTINMILRIFMNVLQIFLVPSFPRQKQHR